MFEADLQKTERWATLDAEERSRIDFAKRTIDSARDHGLEAVIWHLATKQSLGYLEGEGRLGDVARELAKAGEARVGGVTVLVETTRMRSLEGSDTLPLAVWWADDERLLGLDSTIRPMLSGLVSDAARAPIWLSIANGDDQALGFSDYAPVDVSNALQELVSAHSRSMTLSTNGVHDSLAGPLVSGARHMIGSGAATPQAVGVAALRAGWWPQNIPALVQKVSPPR